MRFKSQPQMLLLLSLPQPQHCNLLIAQPLTATWTHPVLSFHQNCVIAQANLCVTSADTFQQVLGSSGSSSAAGVRCQFAARDIVCLHGSESANEDL